MAAQASLFLILFLMAKAVDPESPERWVVWNVGQGQWVTRVEDGVCRHFDMGGERAPWSEVMALCRARRNFVFLSHWDWDHISFVSKARYFLPNLCREELPAGAPAVNKRRMVERVVACGRDARPSWQIWRPEAPTSRERPRTSNEESSIVAWKGMLLPGDSTKFMEKVWIYKMNLRDVEYLAVGHHGSRTSTSAELLAKLPRLKLAVASARWRRYGHPHRDTRAVLERFRVPLLSTEDWGTIHIWQ